MKNFKRKVIESDEQWQKTFLYIHLNPVKHDFVRSVNDWLWSSWVAYENWEEERIINREESLIYFESVDHIKDCIDEIEI